MKRKYSQEEVNERMIGKIYINKDDTNIFVRGKGIGSWTMNYSNKWAWVITFAELIVVFVFLYLIGIYK